MPSEKKIDARMKHSDEEILAAYEQFGSYNRTANHLGVAAPGLMRRIKRIQSKNPDEFIIKPAPDIEKPETLKGRSLLRDAQTGETRLEWVKTDVKAEHRLEAMRAAVDAMREEITPVSPATRPQQRNEDLLNLFVLTDLHIGMLAWAEETDEDWDSDIAERVLVAFFREAIERAPKADQAVLGQIGDFLHYDSMDAITPASKHLLDSDTRYAKMVRLAVRVIRQIIDMLREEYPEVHIIWASGNHDMQGSIWMREMIAALYDHEPRVTVDCSPKPFYCVEHGDVSLFFHHGHQVRINELDRVMAAEFRETFGRTQFSYAHMGHLHNRAAKESSLMIVEQHRTLAARDAYASTHGYQAGREANCITYHKRFGEVARIVVTPEQLM